MVRARAEPGFFFRPPPAHPFPAGADSRLSFRRTAVRIVITPFCYTLGIPPDITEMDRRAVHDLSLSNSPARGQRAAVRLRRAGARCCAQSAALLGHGTRRTACFVHVFPGKAKHPFLSYPNDGIQTDKRGFPQLVRCAGARRMVFFCLLFSSEKQSTPFLPPYPKLCGTRADRRTASSGCSAARGSAPNGFSFVYFSFPKKEK